MISSVVLEQSPWLWVEPQNTHGSTGVVAAASLIVLPTSPDPNIVKWLGVVCAVPELAGGAAGAIAVLTASALLGAVVAGSEVLVLATIVAGRGTAAWASVPARLAARLFAMARFSAWAALIILRASNPFSYVGQSG